MWMLDTNVCVQLIRQRSPSLVQRLRAVDPALLSISAITLAELEHGVAKSAAPERNALALGRLLAPLTVEPFGDAAAARYGTLRAALERQGTPLGGMDLLIAAHALALDRILVTNDQDFRRVPDLVVETWDP